MFYMNQPAPPLHYYPVDRHRIVVGLISGTSADGIDAAVVRFSPVQEGEHLEVLEFRSFPYPEHVRARVMKAAADELTLRETAVLHTELGALFAEAALAVIPEQGCDLVASHGQTVCHLPEQATTLQLGESAVVARRTGVTTIADFRTADMAWGGQGAPLVPLFDAHLLAHPEILRIAVNLGGIANITVIPPGESEGPLSETLVQAWDTGPANCVSDALCRLAGRGEYDPDGEGAARGQVIPELLEELKAHPYFGKEPPKSTGLEDFGEPFARELLERGSFEDLLATVVALSAWSLVRDLKMVAADQSVELVFAGGGTANKTLMARIGTELRQQFPGKVPPIRYFSEFGVPEEGREAVAFAYLGDRTARGLVGAAPGATGAQRAAVLGKVSFPPGF